MKEYILYKGETEVFTSVFSALTIEQINSAEGFALTSAYFVAKGFSKTRARNLTPLILRLAKEMVCLK
jgi:hypothetical protein